MEVSMSVKGRARKSGTDELPSEPERTRICTPVNHIPVKQSANAVAGSRGLWCRMKVARRPSTPACRLPRGGRLGRRTGVDGTRTERRRSRQEKAAGGFLGLELHSGRWARRPGSLTHLGAQGSLRAPGETCEPQAQLRCRGRACEQRRRGRTRAHVLFPILACFSLTISISSLPALDAAPTSYAVLLKWAKRYRNDFSPFCSTRAGEKLV